MPLVYCQGQPLLARVAGTEGVGRDVTAVWSHRWKGLPWGGQEGGNHSACSPGLFYIYTNLWNHFYKLLESQVLDCPHAVSKGE